MFRKPGKIAAENSKRVDYSYTDAQPQKGKNFYRRSMADVDGKASVSTIVELNINGGNNASVSLYPNPISKVLKIVVDSDMDADATVKVTDIIGKVVNDSMDSNTTGIDMSELSNGTYILNTIATKIFYRKSDKELNVVY